MNLQISSFLKPREQVYIHRLVDSYGFVSPEYFSSANCDGRIEQKPPQLDKDEGDYSTDAPPPPRQ
jgi:hypothetical protein